MPIDIRCPCCGNAVKVPEARAERSIVCPVCQGIVSVPSDLESSTEQPAAPAVRMSPPPEVLQYAGRIEGRGSPMGPLARVLLVLAFGGALFVIVFTVLIPAIVYPHGRHRQTTCAANLSGMGKGLHTYASDGNQGMPVAAHWPEKVAIATGQVNYVGRIGSKRGLERDASAGETSAVDGPDGREMSTARNLWLMVRVRGSTPASFICPSSDDGKNDEDNPQAYWDFGDGDATVAGALPAAKSEKAYMQTSYGYQVPYGRCGRPSVDHDSRTVLAADKGPFGMAAEVRGKSLPGAWPAKLNVDSSPDDWAPWNSPNHGGLGGGEGQNVLGADGHADWYNKPLAGVKLDNIYTQWSKPGGSETERVFGNAPSRSAPNLTPMGDTDSLIYP